jgi:hypothetical protein
MSHDQEDSQDVDRPEGRYANYFEVGYNAFEFLLDFGQFYSGSETPRLHTRIITSPNHAKALLETLGQSIEQYERSFGAIQG